VRDVRAEAGANGEEKAWGLFFDFAGGDGLAQLGDADGRAAMLALNLFAAHIIGDGQNLPALQVGADDLDGHNLHIGRLSVRLELAAFAGRL
jgi:hypothetical protein